MNRIASIVLYMLTAALACAMARRINAPLPVRWTGGRMERESFRNRLYMCGIFVVLFALSALRFDIGNDYRQYTQTAHEAFVGGYVVTEAGFNALVRFCYLLAGGECYELVFAVFALVTLAFFLKAFERQSADFPQTLFLFMTLGLYFQTFNTVRYYLALSVALYSMRYVLYGDYVKFVFLILAAAFFHKSVLLVIPAYWLATLGWKRWQVAAGLAVCAACFFGKGIVMKAALALYPSYKNTVYLEDGGSVTSVLRTAAVLALYAWFLCTRARMEDKSSLLGWYAGGEVKGKGWYRELRFYGQLNMMALAAGTFFSFLPVVTRIAYYFGVSQLFLIPLVLHHIEDGRVRKKVTAVIYAACVIYFLVFLLQAHRDGVRLLPYKSWLFETRRYLYK